MAKDIEEFLKMAAERRKAAQGQQAQNPPAQPPAAPVQPARPAPPPQRPTATSPPQKKPRGTTPPPVVGGKQVEVVKRRESVAEHVKSHINTQRLSDQSSSLGQEVGFADDKLEAHLHKKFDHDVGSLAVQTGAGSSTRQGQPLPTPSPAAALQAMLLNKHHLQQTIILSEIMKRPEW